MRILFIGSVVFSKYALEKIIGMKENVVGVVCKESSKINADFFNLGIIASKDNIPFLYSKNINSQETEKWIKKQKPEVIYCFGWSQIIKINILNIPRLGIVGFHPAKIPNNRGRHPLIWALFLGFQSTASTFFFMDEGADTGDILSQKDILISNDDDAESLYQKVIQAALLQIEEFTKELKNNTYKRIHQKKNSGNTWRKRSAIDGKIDWRMSSKAIYNLVRSLTKPYVGAHITISENDYKIWKVKELEHDQYIINFEPGKVIKVDFEKNTIDIKSYDGIIRIVQHEISDLRIIGEYL